MKAKSFITILGILIIIGLFVAAGWFVVNNSQRSASPQTVQPPITSFEECAAAGNPIQLSFPEACVTPDGQRFVNESQKVE